MNRRALTLAALVVAALVAVPTFEPVGAQDRLKAMPGFDQFTKMNQQVQGGVIISGAVTPTWAADGASFTYTSAGKSYRFDLASMKAGGDGGSGGGRWCRRSRRPRRRARRAATGGPGRKERRTRAGANRDAGRCRRRVSEYDGGARPADRLHDLTGREDEGVLSQPEHLDRRRSTGPAKSSSRPTAASRNGSRTAAAAGSTAKSSIRRPPSGGRRTAARSASTASTKVR